MLDIKKKINNRINELDQMINDIDHLNTSIVDIDDTKPKMGTSQLTDMKNAKTKKVKRTPKAPIKTV